jgi:chromosome segregation ATPase
MLTTIITTIAIAAVCYAIYLKQELLNKKDEFDHIKNDNRLKALSIERHLKEKIEMQQEYNVHLTNLRKRVSELELEVSKSNREYRAQENTIQVIVKDCDDLREMVTRKDETIARYVAEINGNKKKPYVFDESKAPKTKSKTKQQVAAAKRLRDENGKFVN